MLHHRTQNPEKRARHAAAHLGKSASARFLRRAMKLPARCNIKRVIYARIIPEFMSEGYRRKP